MSEREQSDDRMNESDWTRMGPEELEVKCRSEALMPEGMKIKEGEWAKLPPMIRSIILDGMSLKSSRRRSGLSSKSR